MVKYQGEKAKTISGSSQKRRSGLISGLPISLDAKEVVLSAITEGIKKRKYAGFISITNTESMYHGMRKADHGAFIREADYSLSDGVGVNLAGYFWGLKLKRYNGPALQLDCSSAGVERSWKHFYYGGKPGVAEKMARRLRNTFPGLQVVGVYSPPFRDLTPDEDAAIIRKINESGADFVWVGLGLLKQERWIAAHRDKLNVPWLIGVGAAFDYLSGEVPWAPKILRAIGTEWLFRLIVQPKLRAKRYWWSAVWVLQASLTGLFGLHFLRPQIIERKSDEH